MALRNPDNKGEDPYDTGFSIVGAIVNIIGLSARQGMGAMARHFRYKRATNDDMITGHFRTRPVATEAQRKARDNFQAGCRGFESRPPLHHSYNAHTNGGSGPKQI